MDMYEWQCLDSFFKNATIGVPNDIKMAKNDDLVKIDRIVYKR